MHVAARDEVLNDTIRISAIQYESTIKHETHKRRDTEHEALHEGISGEEGGRRKAEMHIL